MRVTQLTWDEPVPYSVHDQFGLNPVSVLGVFLEGFFTNSNPFVGIVVLALAFLAVALAGTNFPCDCSRPSDRRE